MPMDPQSSDDRRLWERYARGLPGPDACPPSIELAAWIDGRATGPEAETVETHLAACRVCREAVAVIRLEQVEVAGRLVPDGVIAAARTLVEARRQSPGPRRRMRLADWLTPSMGPGGWGVAAAASIAICFVGYRVGSLQPTLDGVKADEVLVNEMSFGLLNGSDEELMLVLEAVR